MEGKMLSYYQDTQRYASALLCILLLYPVFALSYKIQLL